MLKQLKDLYQLLDVGQKKRLLRLQILVVMMAFAELTSVVAIAPFMSLVADPSVLNGDGLVAGLYSISGIEQPRSFLFWLGVAVLVMLTLAASISMITIWRLSMYGSRVGAEISSRLYRHYMYQNWLFHAGGSSSQLTNKIAQETARLTNGVINPFMQMNARLTLVVLMSVALVLYDPAVAVIGIGIFSFAYLLIFKFIRKRIVRNGKQVTNAQKQRFKMMGEGFGGIKDVILLGRQALFVNQFDEACKQVAVAQGRNQVMTQTPRYIMELVAFGTIIFLTLFLLSSKEGGIQNVLPILSVFALAGMKLLPAFQQVYASISQIRGSLVAFEEIRDDLSNSLNEQTGSLIKNKNIKNDNSKDAGFWHAENEIKFEGVTYSYPGKSSKALNDVCLTIPVKKVIGLVGESGSGKSTAVDILLGLLEPDNGRVTIDGIELSRDNIRSWQNMIGFVPQSIFLSDNSIAANIAYGVPENEINIDKLRKAASLAHLDSFLRELPDGLFARVGERGVQLSGGQRQRIGIARALYEEAEILVLDEATSALDGITEKKIMEAIHDFSGQKTIIIIAHRLATVKKCDSIFLFSKGRLIDEGSFEDLCSRNAIFKKMAANA